MKYLFILGRNPVLSISEIIAAMPTAKIESADDEIAVVVANELAAGFLNVLGGTIKIALVDAEFDSPTAINAEVMRNYLPPRDGRVIFGLSIYGRVPPPQCRNLYMEGLALKKSLKEEGRRARYVVSREQQLSSVVVAKNKLIEEGAEFIIAKLSGRTYLAHTLAIQEFEAYGERDFDRPGRSARRGMLPPKLSQMMVNLAGSDKSLPLLDPFCGSGTVLGEALLMGYTQVIGADLSPEAVSDTKAYLDWLANSRPELKDRARVFQSDARLIDKTIEPNSISAAVFEPLLGPPQSGTETPAMLEQLMKNSLLPLYRDALASIAKILRPNGTVVASFPVFNRRARPIFVPLAQICGELKIEPLVADPDLARALPLTPNGGGLYERPDQFVGREIVRLRKV